MDAASETKNKKLDVESLINDGVIKSKIDPSDRDKMIDKLTSEMKKAAKDLDFEQAAAIRDVIIALKEGAQ